MVSGNCNIFLVIFLILLVSFALLIYCSKLWKKKDYFYMSMPSEIRGGGGGISKPAAASQSAETMGDVVLPEFLTLYGTNIVGIFGNVGDNKFSVVLTGEDHTAVYERNHGEITLSSYIRDLADITPSVNLFLEYPNEDFVPLEAWEDKLFGTSNSPIAIIGKDIGLNKPHNVNLLKIDIRDLVLSVVGNFDYARLSNIVELIKLKKHKEIQEQSMEYFISTAIDLLDVYPPGNDIFEIEYFKYLCDVNVIIDNSSYLDREKIHNAQQIQDFVFEFYANEVREDFAEKMSNLIKFLNKNGRNFNGKTIEILALAADALFYLFRSIVDIHILLILLSQEGKNINICALGFSHSFAIGKIIHDNFANQLLFDSNKISREGEMAEIPNYTNLERILFTPE